MTAVSPGGLPGLVWWGPLGEAAPGVTRVGSPQGELLLLCPHRHVLSALTKGHTEGHARQDVPSGLHSVLLYQQKRNEHHIQKYVFLRPGMELSSTAPVWQA